MARSLTVDDARESLNAHVASKGREIFERYGPIIGLHELMLILNDRKCVRYPCALVFDTAALEPGEFAHPMALGARPEDGFTLHVHPHFHTRPNEVPLLALYQLVLVNYGEFASTEDAETFGAEALGLSREQYYQRLCSLADEVGGGTAESSCDCGGGCH
jgi:hypothetical protein